MGSAWSPFLLAGIGGELFLQGFFCAAQDGFVLGRGQGVVVLGPGLRAIRLVPTASAVLPAAAFPL